MPCSPFGTGWEPVDWINSRRDRVGKHCRMAQQDTLAVPPMPKHVGLNEDLVKILRENLLQQERPRGHRRSPAAISPRLSPRNSPRLLRRMLLNNNIHKQRRFTVAHTW